MGDEGAGALSTNEPIGEPTAGRGVGWQLTPSAREQLRSLQKPPRC